MKLIKQIAAILLLSIFILPCALAACTGGNSQLIFRIHQPFNAHAQQWDAAPPFYDEDLCFDQIFGSTFLGANPHACTGTNVVAVLSTATNAHVEEKTQGNYAFPACYGNLSCSFKPVCSGDESCVATVSGITNAVVATCTDPLAFNTKICCKNIAPTAPQCSIISVQPNPVYVGDSGTITVSYLNFSPTTGTAGISCGDGASPTMPFCSAGTCTFACGPYSSAGNNTISVQLGNGAGGTVDCGTTNLVSNLVPVSTAPAFQITSFELAPNIVTLDESNLPQSVTASISVANNGAEGEAVVRLEVFGPQSGESGLVELSESRVIAASSEQSFSFTFDVDNSWPAENYFAYARVFDTETPPNLHDVIMRVLTVNLKRPVPVPELDLLLVPLIALSALALLYAGRKGRGQ
jgi:hypothetical protein